MAMKKKLYEIIFGTTEQNGKSFDVVLLILILLSVFIANHIVFSLMMVANNINQLNHNNCFIRLFELVFVERYMAKKEMIIKR